MSAFQEYTSAMTRNWAVGFGIVALIRVPDASTEPLSWWFLANGALFAALIPVVITLRALGLVVGAKALGMTSFFVDIGGGKPILERDLGRTRITVYSRPIHSFVRCSTSSRTWPRLRYGSLLTTGLVTHVAVAAVFAAAYPEQIWDLLLAKRLLHGLAPVEMLLLANSIWFFITLWPTRGHPADGTPSSDGWELVKLPFVKEAELRKWPATHYLQNLSLHGVRKEFDQASLWLDGLKKEFPWWPIEHADRVSGYHLNLEDYQGARDFLLGVLENPELAAEKIPGLKSDLALANLLLDRADLLEEAEALSLEALQAKPEESDIQGIRGAVLVRAGKVEEGLRLLNSSYMSAKGYDYASIHCWISIGEAKQGNLLAARDHLDRARALQPECVFLPMAEAELAGKHGAEELS